MHTPHTDDSRATAPKVSRRSLLQSGAVIAGTTALGLGAAIATQPRAPKQSRHDADTADHNAGTEHSGTTTPQTAESPQEPTLFGHETVAFYGVRQAGVTTPAQANLVLVCFTVADDLGIEGARRLLTVVSADIAALTAGTQALADTEPELGALPSNLTVTVGVGPGFLQKAQLAALCPPWLKPLPTFRVDKLEEQWGQGDLAVQICGDDEVAVAHARRVITRQLSRWATPLWVQRGFKGARNAQDAGTTMRNLMGQVDGTANPSRQHSQSVVWCGQDQGIWEHGTSMVVRRISMNLDTWDNVDRVAREDSLGRTMSTGAPLTGTKEHDEPDFEATNEYGFTVIPAYSHVRRARSENPEEVIWRRAYNYDDGPLTGDSQSGLVFISFQADVVRQYLPLQKRLDELDALNEWTTPIGSAVFAVLPGCQPGEYLGQRLVESV